MGYQQINTTFSLKRLLIDQDYVLLINHIEFDPVQYGTGMPFSMWPSFANIAIIVPVHIWIASLSFSIQ